MNFLNDIWLLCGIVAFLYIWFETDAFIEWSALLHLKCFKYEEYNKIKKSPLSAIAGKSYTDFLLYTYGKSFFIRLITCPICFSVWVNLVALGVFYFSIGTFLVIGFNVLVTWLVYHGLRAALKLLE